MREGVLSQADQVFNPIHRAHSQAGQVFTPIHEFSHLGRHVFSATTSTSATPSHLRPFVSATTPENDGWQQIPIRSGCQPQNFTPTPKFIQVVLQPHHLSVAELRNLSAHRTGKQLLLEFFCTPTYGKSMEGKTLRVLIDSGAQASLIRRGLFTSALRDARRPLALHTVSGAAMAGGKQSVWITLPFWQLGQGETRKTSLNFEFYEAPISVDLILGYPECKKFRLVIDTHGDALAMKRNAYSMDPLIPIKEKNSPLLMCCPHVQKKMLPLCC